MPSVWQAYKGIDPKAPKAVFEQIINGSWQINLIPRLICSLCHSFLFSPRHWFPYHLAALTSQEDRKTLVQALLTDVKNNRFPTNGK